MNGKRYVIFLNVLGSKKEQRRRYYIQKKVRYVRFPFKDNEIII